MSGLGTFTDKFRQLLPVPDSSEGTSNHTYLDLFKVERVDLSTLKQHLDALPQHPYLPATRELRRTIRAHQPEYLHAGVNELLKHYLISLDHRNQENLSVQVWGAIAGLLRYTQVIEYPFTVDFWDYLSSCIEPVLVFVLDQCYLKAAEISLEHVMQMGRRAVGAGLHTSQVQHALRIVELKCSESAHDKLFNLARDYRQNMES